MEHIYIIYIQFFKVNIYFFYYRYLKILIISFLYEFFIYLVLTKYLFIINILYYCLYVLYVYKYIYFHNSQVLSWYVLIVSCEHKLYTIHDDFFWSFLKIKKVECVIFRISKKTIVLIYVEYIKNKRIFVFAKKKFLVIINEIYNDLLYIIVVNQRFSKN